MHLGHPLPRCRQARPQFCWTQGSRLDEARGGFGLPSRARVGEKRWGRGTKYSSSSTRGDGLHQMPRRFRASWNPGAKAFLFASVGCPAMTVTGPEEKKELEPGVSLSCVGSGKTKGRSPTRTGQNWQKRTAGGDSSLKLGQHMCVRAPQGRDTHVFCRKSPNKRTKSPVGGLLVLHCLHGRLKSSLRLRTRAP